MSFMTQYSKICHLGHIECCKLKKSEKRAGNFVAVQWLGLHTLTAEGPGWIPGWGIKIPLAVRSGQNKKS